MGKKSTGKKVWGKKYGEKVREKVRRKKDGEKKYGKKGGNPNFRSKGPTRAGTPQLPVAHVRTLPPLRVTSLPVALSVMRNRSLP